jgi:hydroxyethylthiazole kinase-like uncharacterized protein yjeF
MPGDIPVPIDPSTLRTWLRPRPRDCHKGDFGSVGILGGAPGMSGAALMAARAALLLGAGRVYCALLDERVAVDYTTPEVMVATPDTILGIAAPACLVVGPGLGRATAARQWLEAALAQPLPLLLDADALNLLAADPDLQDCLQSREMPSLLTPHPGEVGRLLGIPSAEVQASRARSGRRLAEHYGAHVVLKGAGSLVCSPSGELRQNPSGNPGMAAPGMGDVLAGMIGALCAQGLDLARAACLGVYLHGAAGDRAVADGCGPVGLTAGELALRARALLNGLIADA